MDTNLDLRFSSKLTIFLYSSLDCFDKIVMDRGTCAVASRLAAGRSVEKATAVIIVGFDPLCTVARRRLLAVEDEEQGLPVFALTSRKVGRVDQYCNSTLTAQADATQSNRERG